MPRAKVVKLHQSAPDPGVNPPPPADLGEAGMALWASIIADFHIEDGAETMWLAQACKAIDRAEQCAELIHLNGLTVPSSQGLSGHPLLKTELTARALAARLIGKITGPAPKLGRPPGRAGGKWN